MNSEEGHALLMALAVLAMSTLLVVPFLHMVSTTQVSSRVYSDSLADRYSSDAGVEDAIWRLTNGDLAAELPTPGDSTSYALDDEVNETTIEVEVTKGHGVIARDDFESGAWSGGTGWLGSWQHTGSAAVVSSGDPEEGYYHLMLSGNDDLVKRSVDLSSVQGYDVRLYFWAKAKSFQGGEEVWFLVSPNGTDWTPVKTWANGDDDNAYRFYDIDISSYELTDQFWIAYETYMSGPQSYFYVDAITVVKKLPGSTPAIPSDDFESGDWSGGFHWLGNWEPSGNVVITPSRSPYEGKFHLEITGPTGYIKRQTDLSDFQIARLQFWAKGSHLETGDSTDCLVSGDGVDWYSLITWTIDDSELGYCFVEVDIPPLALSEGSWIAFQSNMSSTSDHFNVDDLKVIGASFSYEIVSTAGGTTTRATISIDDGEVSVHSWQTGKDTQ